MLKSDLRNKIWHYIKEFKSKPTKLICDGYNYRELLGDGFPDTGSIIIPMYDSFRHGDFSIMSIHDEQSDIMKFNKEDVIHLQVTILKCEGWLISE